jgi:hypothetical protein
MSDNWHPNAGLDKPALDASQPRPNIYYYKYIWY